MINLPSETLPTYLWKRRPKGGGLTNPNPFKTEPVSEFESPMLNITGLLLHPPSTFEAKHRLTATTNMTAGQIEPTPFSFIFILPTVHTDLIYTVSVLLQIPLFFYRHEEPKW